FRAVAGQVIKLPRTLVQGDQLPLALSYRPVSLVFPEQGRVRGAPAGAEDRRETPPFHRQDIRAGVRCWIVNAGDLEARGHDVDDVARFVRDIRSTNDRGPVGDQRGGDASFQRLVLVAAKRRVAQLRPGAAVDVARIPGTGWNVFRRAFRLAVAAVVREKQN